MDGDMRLGYETAMAVWAADEGSIGCRALAAGGRSFRYISTTSFKVVAFFNVTFLWKTWNEHVI